MNKLGDVVFCVDCDRERQAHLEIAEAASDTPPDTTRDAIRDTNQDTIADPDRAAHPDAAAQSPEQDQHPRRMATKKDANGDPLCSQCLDDRQAKRRAEFMLSDDRRTVVHWPRRGRASDPKPVLLSSANPGANSSPVPGAMSGTMSGITPGTNGGARPKLAKLAKLTALPKEAPTKNKAAFVRSLPPGTPAKDVIAQARKQGLEITPAYVYVIRSNDGARRSNGVAQPAQREVLAKTNGKALNGKAPNGKAPNGEALNGRGLHSRLLDTRALRIPKPNDRGIERKFMWLAVELGFLRTEQLLDELRTKIKVVFAH